MTGSGCIRQGMSITSSVSGRARPQLVLAGRVRMAALLYIRDASPRRKKIHADSIPIMDTKNLHQKHRLCRWAKLAHGYATGPSQQAHRYPQKTLDPKDSIFFFRYRAKERESGIYSSLTQAVAPAATETCVAAAALAGTGGWGSRLIEEGRVCELNVHYVWTDGQQWRRKGRKTQMSPLGNDGSGTASDYGEDGETLKDQFVGGPSLGLFLPSWWEVDKKETLRTKAFGRNKEPRNYCRHYCITKGI